jgi:hypothetical protein
MIYAQRPDATACAEYDLWNSQMRCHIRRGSKGIALVDNTGNQPKLRYGFHVADTEERIRLNLHRGRSLRKTCRLLKLHWKTAITFPPVKV